MSSSQQKGPHPQSHDATPDFSRPSSVLLSSINEHTNTPPSLLGAIETSPLLPSSSNRATEPPSTPTYSKPRYSRSPSPVKRTWEVFFRRSKYYIPGLEWIPNYTLKLFWGDLAAGVSVASVLIPQSMSYATSLAHLDASTGLFASAIPGLVYALFGTCRQLNVAPEAALSLLVGQTISAHVKGDPHSPHGVLVATAISTIITFQVGLFSFILGLLRLGFIDVILSRALLRGFVTAVGVVILIEQLIPMLGLEQFQHSLPTPPSTTPEKFVFLIEHVWAHAHPLTTAISFISLSSLIVFRSTKRRIADVSRSWKWVKYIPEVFILVVVTTILSEAYDWSERGVNVLGRVTIDTGTLFDVPLKRSTLKHLKKTTSTACIIAVAGFLDSIVAAKQNSDRFGYSISPNRELVALGAGNLVSSFFPGTLPAYGSITRSRMNADVGGRTQMASVVCSLLVVLAVIFLLPALTYLPKCVLAAIIGLVVNTILAEAPHDVGYFWNMSAWTELCLMFITFVSTVAWSVEVGIVVSVAVSLLLIVRRSSKTHIKILGRVPNSDRWKPVDENPENREEVPGVLIVRLRDDLDFANSGQIKERLRRLELYGAQRAHPSEAARRQETYAVVFHMADVEEIDASALQIFKELTATYKSRNVQVHFAHLREKHLVTFQKADIVPDIIPLAHMHDNVASAMHAIESDMRV